MYVLQDYRFDSVERLPIIRCDPFTDVVAQLDCKLFALSWSRYMTVSAVFLPFLRSAPLPHSHLPLILRLFSLAYNQYSKPSISSLAR